VYSLAEKIVMAGAVIMVILLFTFLGIWYLDCKELGGTLVRGIIWFECIQ